MSIENKISYENPKAGKLAIFVGKMGRGIGITSAVVGGGGWVYSKIYEILPFLQENPSLEKSAHFFKNNYAPFLYVGGTLFVAGLISGVVGRVQHWWANKNYYRK